jgi:hypothetical protein
MTTTLAPRFWASAMKGQLESRESWSIPFMQLRLGSFRCSAPTHDLAHLDTNSLAANWWIRAQRAMVA